MNTDLRPAYYTDVVDLYKRALELQGITAHQRRQLLNDIRSLIPAAENRWNFRWVIWPLGILTLSVPILVIVELVIGRPADLPQGLLSLASAGAGALAAFLTPQGKRTPEYGATGPSGIDATQSSSGASRGSQSSVAQSRAGQPVVP